MSTKLRTQKVSKIGQRGGQEIVLWRLSDETFFGRFDELTDKQIRFFLAQRRGLAHRGGTLIVVEEPREFAAAANDIQSMVEGGFIVREDILAIARRIKSEHAAGERRATS